MRPSEKAQWCNRPSENAFAGFQTASLYGRMPAKGREEGYRPSENGVSDGL
ncbi:hypothetical protein HMPREF9120_01049 [Neisseria sp. oral taxon 020 str. F0370]|nr:hypothetical protein HMPREF9120_01049 [Neisseria sp. oral taxon 020 str. F0370]